MADKLHKLFTSADGIHVLYAWEVAALGDITTTDDDIGKVAKVAARYYLLCDRVPIEGGGYTIVWREVGPDLTTLSDAITINTTNIATNTAAIALKADALFSIISSTSTSYTPTLANVAKLHIITNASAIVFTVPANASVAYAIGSVLPLMQGGAGQITLTPAGGVTIRVPSGTVAKLRTQYSRGTLEKIATDEWVASGDLAYA